MITQPRRIAALAVLVFAALNGVTPAQPVPVFPVPISTDGLFPPFNPNGIAGGHAQTWDGRVIIMADDSNGPEVWLVKVIRPEALTANSVGEPEFQAGVTFSDPGAVLDTSAATTSAIPVVGATACAVAQAPGFDENPFPCTLNGTSSAQGTYLCYELLLFAEIPSPVGAQLALTRARVIVRDPYTASADVHDARLLGPLQGLLTSIGNPVIGIECSATLDGRLLVFQGDNAAVENAPGADPAAFNINLEYCWNHNPGDPNGWTEQSNVANMYHVDSEVLVDGIPFHRRCPIARLPLRGADGAEYRPFDFYRGAYPWISLDGTEIVHTTDGRAALTIVGAITNYEAVHIDGPLNPDRYVTERLFTSAIGLAPGFWTPFRNRRRPIAPVPYTAGRPVYSLYSANTQSYGEVSFEHRDGDYLVYLHMNELILTNDGRHDPSRTPDGSGFNNVGYLENSAFPQEAFGVDGTFGVVGQSVVFGEDSLIRVPHAPSLENVTDSVTVQAWVQRLAPVGSFTRVVEKPGSYGMFIDPMGNVYVGVVVGGGVKFMGPLAPELPIGGWAHVAFAYNGGTGVMQAWINGGSVAVQTFPAGFVDGSQLDLIVGPAGTSGGGAPMLLLDEVGVSNVVRTEYEIARDAFFPLPGPTLTTAGINLPLGLDARDLRVPASNVPTPEIVGLGAQLFHEKGLSTNGTSCATCHDPGSGFSDGLPVANLAFESFIPARNTPTILNRAFSTHQFFDGRALSLEEQALLPVLNPAEMNSTIAGVLAFLNSSPKYLTKFQDAFGPGIGPSEDTLQRALASYQRVQLSGDSRVDRFEAGVGSLTPTERRGYGLFHGRARCVACHTGSNYTDEAFHDTGIHSDDLGRYLSSGRQIDHWRFKTPTLRDLALTGPYLHDGSATTLRQVVDIYDAGGISERTPDFEIRALGLTEQEKDDLVAFLLALGSN